MSPKKYIKKPVIIEAMQFDGSENSLNAIYDWMLASEYMGSANGHGYDSTGARDNGEIRIETLEGIMVALPTYYIIKGVNGEFYPCREDIFIKTYEEVE